MRNPERIERILDLLKQIWIKQPDSRFMQMMSNISWNYSAANNDYGKEYSYSKWETPKGNVIFNKDVVDVDLFYLEDDKLEQFLKDYLKQIDEDIKQSKTIGELRKELAVKTAPNHGLVDLYKRGK
jgi:hypothetical protein